MKRRNSLVLFLFLPSVLCSQVLLDTVWFDQHWKQASRQDASYFRLVMADTSGKVQFLVRDYYLNGVLQMEGAYRSINPDVRNGEFVYYFPGGQKMLQCTYRNNVPEGVVTEWYENGNKKSEIGYKNGLLDGPFTAWNEDGKPALSMNYRNNELDGKFVSYYPNGRKVREDYYVKGELKKKRCFTSEGKDTTWFPYLAMPEFPGGKNRFMKFIDEHLVYPAEALAKRLQGRVDVEVSVGTDGKLFNIKVVHSDREDFAREALRVLASSPPWKPGYKDGQPVEMTITVPVWFRIK